MLFKELWQLKKWKTCCSRKSTVSKMNVETGLLNCQILKWKVIVIFVFLAGLETENNKWSKNKKKRKLNHNGFWEWFWSYWFVRLSKWKWKVISHRSKKRTKRYTWLKNPCIHRKIIFYDELQCPFFTFFCSFFVYHV